MSKEFKIIRTDESYKYCLEIMVNTDETECRCNLTKKIKMAKLKNEDLLALLEESGITFGIQFKEVKLFCYRATSGKNPENFLVAKARPPAKDIDAHLVLKVMPTKDSLQIEEKENIDYSKLSLFENIKKGDTIAIWQDVEKGRKGITVTGKDIVAEQLEKITSVDTIKIGEGVTYQENNKAFIALLDGRLEYNNNTLSITDKLELKTPVGVLTGFINFIGHVHIKGDVSDGFAVHGEKGVIIDKSIGNCKLSSSGDITLKGITGIDSFATIKAGGNIKALYLHGVDVECAKDILVTKEVLHSNLKSLGKITINGMIADAHALALQGMIIDIVGSDVGVKTFLTAGTDYRTINKIADLEEILQKKKNIQEKMLAAVRPYAKKKIENLSIKGRKIMLGLLKEAQKAVTEVNQLQKQMDELIKNDIRNYANAKINILQQLNPNTSIKLGNTTLITAKLQLGPISIIEYHTGDLRFLPKTSLEVNAKDIKRKMITAEQIKAKQKS